MIEVDDKEVITDKIRNMDENARLVLFQDVVWRELFRRRYSIPVRDGICEHLKAPDPETLIAICADMIESAGLEKTYERRAQLKYCKATVL